MRGSAIRTMDANEAVADAACRASDATGAYHAFVTREDQSV